MHVHKAEDKLTYVLEGEIDCVPEERSETASMGSFFFVPKGTAPHPLQPWTGCRKDTGQPHAAWVRRLLGGSVAAVGEHRW
jgi:glyoxylate utilization-related uncharacterized protein